MVTLLPAEAVLLPGVRQAAGRDLTLDRVKIKGNLSRVFGDRV